MQFIHPANTLATGLSNISTQTETSLLQRVIAPLQARRGNDPTVKEAIKAERREREQSHLYNWKRERDFSFKGNRLGNMLCINSYLGKVIIKLTPCGNQTHKIVSHFNLTAHNNCQLFFKIFFENVLLEVT